MLVTPPLAHPMLQSWSISVAPSPIFSQALPLHMFVVVFLLQWTD